MASPFSSKALKALLRIIGSASLLAIVAVLMPREWMAVCHSKIGLGSFPDGGTFEYLARTLSAFYAMYGGLLWLVSSDVERHARVIGYLAVAGIAFGVTTLWVDLKVGLPLWWILMEGPWLIALDVAILVLLRRSQRPPSRESRTGST